MESVTIRPATPEDVPALLAIYAHYVQETAVTFEYEVPSQREFARRLSDTLERFPYLAAEQDGQLAGYAYAGPFHTRAAYQWSAETTIYLRPEQRGKGLGCALYRALENILTKQHIQNVNACIAVPVEENDPYLTNRSAEFHARMGYRLVGRFHQCGYKFGRWYDMIWMEKLLGDHPAQPPAVIPFPALPVRRSEQLTAGILL